MATDAADSVGRGPPHAGVLHLIISLLALTALSHVTLLLSPCGTPCFFGDKQLGDGTQKPVGAGHHLRLNLSLRA